MSPPNKPAQSFWQIWNMCFGFLGLQFGFALQNANVSRIFQTLGASIDQIPILWIAAPLTGLLVQPIIGYFSDRTWTRLGRRKPYFVVGAVLAATALWCMPRAPALIVAAALLWVLDASINISMEPFRAFVGDQLAPAQRPRGYAMQSFFIGVGAVVASLLPWLLHHAGVDDQSSRSAVDTHQIPATVRRAFDIGAAVLALTMFWTVLRTREYSPEQLRSFADAHPDHSSADSPIKPLAQGGDRSLRGLIWAAVGAAGLGAVYARSADKQLYLLGAGALFWGLAQIIHTHWQRPGMFATLMSDLENMPPTMRRLAPVQFFSWLALFSMWIYTTPAVAQHFFAAGDAHSRAYNEGADWVDVLFAAYNGFAALAAVALPLLVRRAGLARTHLICLWLGALGLFSFLWLQQPHALLFSMLGVGIAWAAILSLPYALLAGSVPAEKMGVYMGIFNFFIVIPQLVAASVLGLVLKGLFHNQPINAFAIGGASLLIAGALTLRVPPAAAIAAAAADV